jgi:hypothetical protein
VRRYARRWAKEHGAATAAVYVPLSFAPGEAYQFDWSHEVVLLSGATVTVKVAHVRLCHSRMLFVRAYPRETQDRAIPMSDWVERIPFAETRNYVQRVMENMQVYRARFGASAATVEPNLHRAATIVRVLNRPRWSLFPCLVRSLGCRLWVDPCGERRTGYRLRPGTG